MSGRANVTLRKACSAVELLGTADGEGWCSADRSLLEEPQHSPAARGQHRLSVGVVAGLAIRVSNCLY